MADEIRKVGIVGGGVIGAGWAARFALSARQRRSLPMPAGR